MAVRNHIRSDRQVLSKSIVVLVVSAILHILIIRYASFDRHSNVEIKDSTPIEVSEIPPEVIEQLIQNKKSSQAKPKAKKEMEMAESEDANNREIDPNARFFSDKNQKATREEKAKNTDDFRKKMGTGGSGTEAKAERNAIPPTGESVGNEVTEPITGEDTTGVIEKKSANGVKRDWKTLSFKDLSIGGDGGAAAATDDRLEGVAAGDRTILSTREFQFYSYYHRIKELLRQYWKPNVERKLAHLWGRGKTVQEDEMVTRLVVLLDPSGGIQKISRVASCGFIELDEAAVEAFQKAGPFPNPPKGIIEKDGFVRIQWDFILKTEAAPKIQFQAAGAPSGPP